MKKKKKNIKTISLKSLLSPFFAHTKISSKLRKIKGIKIKKVQSLKIVKSVNFKYIAMEIKSTSSIIKQREKIKNL